MTHLCTLSKDLNQCLLLNWMFLYSWFPPLFDTRSATYVQRIPNDFK